MRTVKQVSDLTGISIRTLHYYDEIGLLKPSKVTEAGYRLYDDEDIKTLQQILFFKELEIPLKEVKEIMLSPHFDRIQALKSQKELLKIKRKRLDDLITLIDKTIEGDDNMSFKEFDMTEYFNVLEEFKRDNEEKIIKMYGSMEKYDELIETCKSNEDKIAKTAVKLYGSVEKYTEALKKNLNSNKLYDFQEQFDNFKKDLLEDSNPKLKELIDRLVSNIDKDPSSKEVRYISKEIYQLIKNDYELFRGDNGDDNWYYMIKNYSVNPDWIKKVNEKYKEGSSEFIGKALSISLGGKKPRAEIIYDEFTKDLSKDPTSKEIQEIVKEIDDEHKINSKLYGVEEGENYIGYMSEFYLENKNFIEVTDKKYGEGASMFIGKAFKFYGEQINNK